MPTDAFAVGEPWRTEQRAAERAGVVAKIDARLVRRRYVRLAQLGAVKDVVAAAFAARARVEPAVRAARHGAGLIEVDIGTVVDPGEIVAIAFLAAGANAITTHRWHAHATRTLAKPVAPDRARRAARKRLTRTELFRHDAQPERFFAQRLARSHPTVRAVHRMIRQAAR